jgi:hypothetical protein
MRSITSMLVGAALCAGVAAFPAHAVPLTGQSDSVHNQGIEQVAVRCGPDAHYIRGHRDKAGHYVRGRCVRNRHRG